MLKYIFFLIMGVLLGFFSPDKKWIKKTRLALLPFSILCLLFFMGIEIGKDPHLKYKILNFGFFASVIAISSIIFSVLAVFIIIKIYKRYIQRTI